MTGSNKLTKRDYLKTSLRAFFCQNGFNYSNYQGLGYANVMYPALKKHYEEDQEGFYQALEENCEFYNTNPHFLPFITSLHLVMLENGRPAKETRSIKMALMGPLAGIGDPVFWFTVRPILGAIAASLATGGSIIAPLFFFIAWNAIRIGFLWYTQELGYKKGSEITSDLSGGVLQTITKGASILGMFVMGVLVMRWTNIKFPLVVSKVQLADKAYIHFPGEKEHVTGGVLQDIVTKATSGDFSLTPEKVTTLQDNLNQLIPGFAALLLTFACMWLLKRKVSPVAIIFGLFALGILAHLAKLM